MSKSISPLYVGLLLIILCLAISFVITWYTKGITESVFQQSDIYESINCSIIKDAITPPFDYCIKYDIYRSNEPNFNAVCKCCWDRKDVLGFMYCRFYAINYIDENTTEVYEIRGLGV